MHMKSYGAYIISNICSFFYYEKDYWFCDVFCGIWDFDRTVHFKRLDLCLFCYGIDVCGISDVLQIKKELHKQFLTISY